MNKRSGLIHLDKNLLRFQKLWATALGVMLAFIYPTHVKLYVKLSKVGVLMIGSQLFTGNIE